MPPKSTTLPQRTTRSTAATRLDIAQGKAKATWSSQEPTPAKPAPLHPTHLPQLHSASLGINHLTPIQLAQHQLVPSAPQHTALLARATQGPAQPAAQRVRAQQHTAQRREGNAPPLFLFSDSVNTDRFEYVLVSLSKVMVPISDVKIMHWFYFSEVNLQFCLQLVRSKIHKGFKFCEFNKPVFF